jgi:signal peptidase I
VVRRTLLGLVGLVVVVLALRLLVAEPYTVRQASMQPTLRDGQTVLVDKVSLRWSPLRRGELVAFRGAGGWSVKRVVALGGDRVAGRDAVLVINGRPVAEPYLGGSAEDGTYFGPVTVPAGQVFVLGDNRLGSVDSRAYGPLDRNSVIGRVRG